MMARVMVGLLGAPVVLGLLWMGGTPFALMCSFIAGVAAWEFSAMGYGSGHPATTALAVAASIGFVIDASFGLGQSPHILTLVVLGPLLLQVVRGKPSKAMSETALAAFSPLYTGWCLSRFCLIRVSFADAGRGLALLVIVLIWMCDMGAFFTGRRFGKRKLAPALSPKKTVEGCVGGYAWAIVGATAFKALGDATGLWYTLNWPTSFALAVLVATAGQIGDLAESAMKRDAGCKDAGWIFPGHGGMLDRFDSLLFAGPAAYFFLLRILPILTGR